MKDGPRKGACLWTDTDSNTNFSSLGCGSAVSVFSIQHVFKEKETTSHGPRFLLSLTSCWVRVSKPATFLKEHKNKSYSRKTKIKSPQMYNANYTEQFLFETYFFKKPYFIFGRDKSFLELFNCTSKSWQL